MKNPKGIRGVDASKSDPHPLHERTRRFAGEEAQPSAANPTARDEIIYFNVTPRMDMSRSRHAEQAKHDCRAAAAFVCKMLLVAESSRKEPRFLRQ